MEGGKQTLKLSENMLTVSRNLETKPALALLQPDGEKTKSFGETAFLLSDLYLQRGRECKACREGGARGDAMLVPK